MATAIRKIANKANKERTRMTSHELEGTKEREDKGKTVHGWACQRRFGW